MSTLLPLERLSIRCLGCDYVPISGGGNGRPIDSAAYDSWEMARLCSIECGEPFDLVPTHIKGSSASRRMN